MSIAFLAGAVALTLFGVFILIDSLVEVMRQEHPSIGTTVLFGRQIWSGWVMIAALAYSAVPPLVLGHMKLEPARQLHDKTLKADSDMNRADWLTAGAGIVGILGIGIGWWWADAAAAGVISVAIVKDGLTNLKRVVSDLMDHEPTTRGRRPLRRAGAATLRAGRPAMGPLREFREERDVSAEQRLYASAEGAEHRPRSNDDAAHHTEIRHDSISRQVEARGRHVVGYVGGLRSDDGSHRSCAVVGDVRSGSFLVPQGSDHLAHDIDSPHLPPTPVDRLGRRPPCAAGAGNLLVMRCGSYLGSSIP